MATLSQKRVWFSVLGFASMVVLSFFAHWYFLTLDGTRLETAISITISFIFFGAFSETVLIGKMRSVILAILVTIIGAKAGELFTFFLADTGSALSFYALVGSAIGCIATTLTRNARHAIIEIKDTIILSTFFMALWAVATAGISVIFYPEHINMVWAIVMGIIIAIIFYLFFEDRFDSGSSSRFRFWVGAALPAAGISYAMSQNLLYPLLASIVLAIAAYVADRLHE